MTRGSYSTDLAISGANIHERVRTASNTWTLMDVEVGCGRAPRCLLHPFHPSEIGPQNWTFSHDLGWGSKLDDSTSTTYNGQNRTPYEFFLVPPGCFRGLTCL